MRKLVCALAIVGGAVLVAYCGSTPTEPGSTDALITITETGPQPREVTVARGARVTFRNSDVRPHAVSSDPIQTHTDCPALNDVGTVSPGQSRATGALDVARVCGFHDHNNENDPTFKGRITVQ